MDLIDSVIHSFIGFARARLSLFLNHFSSQLHVRQMSPNVATGRVSAVFANATNPVHF